jgi:anti-sigma regulatory factor (Ser/Thr protein kinase)
MEKRVLIGRWLGSDRNPIPIYDEASVSSARQRVREAGATIGASTVLVESVALIASELTHNQLAHAKQGYLGVKVVERQGIKGIEVVAADLGPGLGKPILVSAGGIRAAGSLGAGLEGVFSLADEVEVDARRAEGVCVIARKFEAPTALCSEIAIAGKPYPGEVISGDDSVYLLTGSGFLAAVCDGLGHGPEAREASNRAMELLMQNANLSLDELLLAVNSGLSDTRGCVLGVVRFTEENRKIQCVLVGDVRAQLYYFKDAHFFTSTPLIVGDSDIPRRRIRVEEIEVPQGGILAMFTDGLETKTSLRGQLDILRRPAIVIAQHLLETHSRGTDDSLVLVARFR